MDTVVYNQFQDACRGVLKRRHLIGSMISNICEWYDYVIYGSLAPILSSVFFPSDDQFVSLMLAFTVFALGFLVRPLGGIIFGHISDKYSRKVAFIRSILLMAIPALAIGLLPSYEAIGRLSPLLLILFRLLQGFAVGGEYPTIVSYITELAPVHKRGYIASFINVTTVTGVLCATLTVAIITKTLSHSELIHYGWRIPFYISFFAILFGYYIRSRLPESPLTKTKRQVTDIPILEAFKRNKSAIIKIFLYSMCICVGYYTFNIFSMTYFTRMLGLDYLPTLAISAGSMVVLMLLIPIVGRVSDVVGRKNVVLIANISLILLIYPIYIGFSYKTLLLAMCSQLVFAVLIALYLAPLPAFIAEQVTTSARCSSIALGYNIAQALFGGTAPIMNMYLIQRFQTELAPSGYLMITGFISLTAIFFMKDVTNKHLM